MIIDMHMHIDDVPSLGWELSPQTCVRSMDEAGVHSAAVMTIADLPGPNPRAMELIAESCDEFAGRLYGFVRLDPNAQDEARRLLTRAVTRFGFRGLKLHPVSTLAHPGSAPTISLIRQAGELGVPTLFHCGDEPLTTPTSIAPAAAACPDATIILGHMGGYFHVDEAIDVAERYGNIVLETSAMPYPDKIREAVAQDRRRPGHLRQRRTGQRTRAGTAEGDARRPDRRADRSRPGRQRHAHAGGLRMTVDGLSFLGTSRFGYRREPAELLGELDTEGIDVALVAPMHPRDGNLDVANKEVAAVVRDHPGRLVAIARVDPWDGDDAIIQLTSAVTDGGAKGVFLHPGEENFQINDTRWRPIAERAAELGVPVLVATGYHCRSEAGQVASFAEWCPGIPVIMTNGGQLNISGLGQVDAELALALPNVHIFTSGVYRDDFLERAVRTFGAERVLFASYAPQFDVGYERRRVHQVHLSDEERALLLSGNATRLFAIGGDQ